MIQNIFREVFVFFYLHTKKQRPRNSHIENKIAASGMVGIIGGSVGINLAYILCSFHKLPQVNAQLWLFVLCVMFIFSYCFYRKGEKYLKSSGDLDNYKVRSSVIIYYILFCILSSGLATFII